MPYDSVFTKKSIEYSNGISVYGTIIIVAFAVILPFLLLYLYDPYVHGMAILLVSCIIMLTCFLIYAFTAELDGHALSRKAGAFLLIPGSALIYMTIIYGILSMLWLFGTTFGFGCLAFLGLIEFMPMFFNSSAVDDAVAWPTLCIATGFNEIQNDG